MSSSQQKTQRVSAVSNGVNWIGLYTFVRSEVLRTFRVVTQTLVTPWISALLYIFIFGSVVGKQIDLINGVPYIKFVLPGILMMNIITGAFGASSNALYFQRFIKNIEELLVAPFSYFEMMAAFTLSAVARTILVALGIYVIAIFFGGSSIEHFWLFLFYSFAVSVIFALLGLIVGLWAKGFEQLNILSTFVIMPLSFLGGMFYSINMLPEKLQFIAHFNPFFYFIDSIRYSMIGVRETSATVGLVMILGLIIVLGAVVHHLFKKGWRLRS